MCSLTQILLCALNHWHQIISLLNHLLKAQSWAKFISFIDQSPVHGKSWHMPYCHRPPFLLNLSKSFILISPVSHTWPGTRYMISKHVWYWMDLGYSSLQDSVGVQTLLKRSGSLPTFAKAVAQWRSTCHRPKCLRFLNQANKLLYKVWSMFYFNINLLAMWYPFRKKNLPLFQQNY